MESSRLRFRPGFIRLVVAVVGICSIAWAAYSINVYRAEAPFAIASRHILAGDRYDADQLDDLRALLNSPEAGEVRQSALSNIAIIRLHLAEAALMAGNAQAIASSLDELKTSVIAALSANPTNSFLWLTQYWARLARGERADANLKFLRMSYELGPNEGWIAARRNPLALSVFPGLPDQFAKLVLDEFDGMVRAGMYREAANILAGAARPVRDRVLTTLAGVDEDDRRRFAKELAAKDLEGAVVPGVGDQPSRPF